jgi:hypothetical protein
MSRSVVVKCFVIVVGITLVLMLRFFLLIGDIAIPYEMGSAVSAVAFYTNHESAKKFNKSTKINYRINKSIILTLSDFRLQKSDLCPTDKYSVGFLVKTEYKVRHYYSLTNNHYFVFKTSKEKFMKGYDDMIKSRIGTNFRWNLHPIYNFTPQYLANIIYDYGYVEPLTLDNNNFEFKLKDDSGNVINNSGGVITIGNE